MLDTTDYIPRTDHQPRRQKDSRRGDRRPLAAPHVQGRDRGRARDRSDRVGRRGVRLPRSERRRQDDDRADAVHAAAADGRNRHRRRPRRRRTTPPRCGGGSASRCRRSASTRCRPAASCSSSSAASTASPASAAAQRADGAARARRPDRRRRPADEDLLGRDEAPARPGQRARPLTRGAVPRRADDRPRSGLAPDDLGRGAADQRRRRHRVPHHAVPRGGRQALRPPGDHRRRPDRRRGHAGAAQGGDGTRRRVGLGRRRRRRARPRPRCPGCRASSGSWPSPTALALYVEDGAGSIAEIVRRLEREQIRVGAISVARPSLDDVFLKATGRRLEGQDDAEQTSRR